MGVLLMRKTYRTVLPALFAGAAAIALLSAGCRSSSVQFKTVPQGTPQGVEAAANGPRSVLLKWSPPYDAIYRYRIERANSKDGAFTPIADVRPEKFSYVDGVDATSTLKDSTTYCYRIIALLGKKGPVSTPSRVIEVTTAPPPVAPLNVNACATGSRAVTISWDPSPSEGVTSYRVERASAADPAFTAVATSATNSCVDGGTPASTLKDSTPYLYRVVTLNHMNSESGPSDLAEVLTLPPPAAVKGLTATSREVRCVPLTWTQSPEADVVRYDIYQAREPDGPFEKIGSAAELATTTFIAGGANPGKLEDEGVYFFRVRAVNAVSAESADSATVRATTREIPPEVTQLAAISARPREVPLSWAASPDTAVMGYEVWRATANADDWTQIARLASRDTTRHLDRGGQKDDASLGLLKDGTAYQYKVVAFNTANVRSSASMPVTATTKMIPATPAALTATTNTAHVVALAWRPNPEKDISGYQIESSKKAAAGFRKLAVVPASDSSAGLTAEEKGFDPGTLRYYRVKAIDNERLESEWSEPVQGRFKPLPDAPSALQTQPDGTSIRLTWQPPSQADIVEYRVWSKKRVFGWTLLGTAPQPEYRIELAADAKPPTLAVTAVDQDKLESEKSKPVKAAQ